MAEAVKEEGSLDQAYYGPAIPTTSDQPPQKNTAADRFRRRGWAPYTILCAIFKVITLVIIVIAVIVLILWLIYQPQALKVYVEDATLVRFDLAGNGTLYYDFSANVSVRNPNKKYDLYYYYLEADAYYDGFRFSYMPLPTMKQGHKSTTVAQLTLQGQAVGVGDTVAATYAREKREGYFTISVTFYTKIRLKMIIVKSAEYSPEADCSVRLATPGNSTSAAVPFQRTECHAQDFS